MKSTLKNTIKNSLMIGSLGAFLFAFSGSAPALADRYDSLRNNVRHDLDRVDRDEQRLRELNRKLDRQRDHDDWRGSHHTQDDITRARIDLQRDRETLRLDQRELDRYRF